MKTNLLDRYGSSSISFATLDDASASSLICSKLSFSHAAKSRAARANYAIALADRVGNGGDQELQDYLSLLKGGCSKEPLDLLRGAGVDMEKPDRVDNALKQFDEMVTELDSLI